MTIVLYYSPKFLLRLGMVQRFLFGWIFGILVAFYWKNTGTGLCTMLKVVWRQNSLLLFIMEIDYGGLLGLMLWWKSKLGSLKLVWVLVTNLFGLPQEKGFMLVQILGILLGWRESNLIVGSWFSFPLPFLSIYSFCGLLWAKTGYRW